MAEKTQPKPPQRLLVTALPEKKAKKRKPEEEKSANKKLLDKARAKTRVNIGSAFERWRQLRDLKRFKSDVEVAVFLLDRYEKHLTGACFSIQTTIIRNVKPPAPPPLSSNGAKSQSTHSMSMEDIRIVDEDGVNIPSQSVDSMDCESSLSSSNEDKQETCIAPVDCSSENGKASREEVAAPQGADGQDKQIMNKQSQNEVNGDIEEDVDEEISTTVGDGRYTVDLGSPSEFIVDEECILQMFKSCRECNKQCAVRKRVQGLKIVITQKCHFCDSNFTWTNLPDADEDDGGDLQINGQTNTATSPSSNTS